MLHVNTMNAAFNASLSPTLTIPDVQLQSTTPEQGITMTMADRTAYDNGPHSIGTDSSTPMSSLNIQELAVSLVIAPPSQSSSGRAQMASEVDDGIPIQFCVASAAPAMIAPEAQLLSSWLGGTREQGSGSPVVARTTTDDTACDNVLRTTTDDTACDNVAHRSSTDAGILMSSLNAQELALSLAINGRAEPPAAESGPTIEPVTAGLKAVRSARKLRKLPTLPPAARGKLSTTPTAMRGNQSARASAQTDSGRVVQASLQGPKEAQPATCALPGMTRAPPALSDPSREQSTLPVSTVSFAPSPPSAKTTLPLSSQHSEPGTLSSLTKKWQKAAKLGALISRVGVSFQHAPSEKFSEHDSLQANAGLQIRSLRSSTMSSSTEIDSRHQIRRLPLDPNNRRLPAVPEYSETTRSDTSVPSESTASRRPKQPEPETLPSLTKRWQKAAKLGEQPHTASHPTHMKFAVTRDISRAGGARVKGFQRSRHRPVAKKKPRESSWFMPMTSRRGSVPDEALESCSHDDPPRRLTMGSLPETSAASTTEASGTTVNVLLDEDVGTDHTIANASVDDEQGGPTRQHDDHDETHVKFLFDIQFDDISFSLPDGTAIVEGVSGRFAAERCTAIMGPSGAGKTTIINLITGKVPLSDGTISVNGTKVGGLQHWKHEVGFVPQEVLLPPPHPLFPVPHCFEISAVILLPVFDMLGVECFLQTTICASNCASSVFVQLRRTSCTDLLRLSKTSSSARG